ncbi:MAG: metalloregulator ArsR/SmtB family transcription factor [Gammaproteobacteria bacterium]|nr:metalloregulator ArsR/SmtB family transcription factor [Gammaproteobacteria bacterium]
MSFDLASRTLKAAADPTRLRLLALLDRGEATVGELQAILEQSQPRVSRHLRLLSDAGLVERFRDGHWIYYRVATTPAARALVRAAIDTLDPQDVELLADRAALDRVKRERQRDAFGDRSALTSTLAGARPGEAELRDVVDELLGDGAVGEVLDIGCGGGSLLRWLAPRARLVVGADVSRSARVLARSRAHQWGLSNCTIRDADVEHLPFDDACFDLVILDEVLSATNDRDAGLREALRVLRPTGRLLILDRIWPVATQLGPNPEGGLIDNQLSAALAAAGGRVTARRWLPGRALEYAVFTAAPAYTLQRTGSDD